MRRRVSSSQTHVRCTASRPCDDAAAVLHLIVETDEPCKLSRAIQGLAVRLARALNRIAGRKGKVFAQRFHAHVLRALREAKNAVGYVVDNFRHHLREDVAPQGANPCSSAGWRDDAPGAGPRVSQARTWLLRAAAMAA